MQKGTANLNPISDSLEEECDNYMRLYRQRRYDEKSVSFALIKQLWTIRVRSGEDLPAPDVPAAVLRQHGFLPDAQVRWVGGLKERLRSRRDSRYGR